ncbi:MAG TPA: Lrp/AsnC family transcriptional regulator [Blastocatellia bacterium]|nr:Lrp/AsnC family transcriptional regulator [Blastocatellia bacterium]
MATNGFDIESPIDGVNWRILTELQRDARLSMAELGRRVGLSAPAAAERVRRLEDAGVIEGYRAMVRMSAVGRPILAFIRISTHATVKDRVAEIAKGMPEVIECHRSTGNDCFILKVAASSMSHLEVVTDAFTDFGKVATSIVLSSPVSGRTVDELT